MTENVVTVVSLQTRLNVFIPKISKLSVRRSRRYSSGTRVGSFPNKETKVSAQWKAMMANLDDVLARTGTVTILYHCFGGVLPLCFVRS